MQRKGNKMNNETLKFNTKAEFITELLSGTKLIDENGCIYLYDENFDNPFIIKEKTYPVENIGSMWNYLTEIKFTIYQLEPIYETRWQMIKDKEKGVSSCTDYFYSDKAIIEYEYTEENGWHKGNSIEVQIN